MSHFAVLVVTDGYPTEDVLAKVLQPFHEYECTGKDDQYVVDVDITAEAREEYEANTELLYEYIDGTRINAFDNRFYRDPTPEEDGKIGKMGGSGWSGGVYISSRDWNDGKGYRTKIHYLPDGWKEVTVPTPELKSFAKFVEYYYGYNVGEKDKYGWCEFIDGAHKVVKRTNPDNKWDWWKTGGRYAGRLVRKNGLVSDISQVSDLDLGAMRLNVIDKNIEFLDDLAKRCKWHGQDKYVLLAEGAQQIARANKLYDELPEPKPRGQEYHNWFNGLDFMDERGKAVWQADFWRSLVLKEGQTCIEWAGDVKPLTFFAAVVDGKWVESGEMGWWGAVSNEKDNWDEVSIQILASLKPDQYVSIVDCHI